MHCIRIYLCHPECWGGGTIGGWGRSLTLPPPPPSEQQQLLLTPKDTAELCPSRNVKWVPVSGLPPLAHPLLAMGCAVLAQRYAGDTAQLCPTELLLDGGWCGAPPPPSGHPCRCGSHLLRFAPQVPTPLTSLVCPYGLHSNASHCLQSSVQTLRSQGYPLRYAQRVPPLLAS